MSLPWPPSDGYEALEYEVRYGLRFKTSTRSARAPIQRRGRQRAAPARDELRAWLDARKSRRPWRVTVT